MLTSEVKDIYPPSVQDNAEYPLGRCFPQSYLFLILKIASLKISYSAIFLLSSRLFSDPHPLPYLPTFGTSFRFLNHQAQFLLPMHFWMSGLLLDLTCLRLPRSVRAVTLPGVHMCSVASGEHCFLVDT